MAMVATTPTTNFGHTGRRATGPHESVHRFAYAHSVPSCGLLDFAPGASQHEAAGRQLAIVDPPIRRLTDRPASRAEWISMFALLPIAGPRAPARLTGSISLPYMPLTLSSDRDLRACRS